MDFSLELQDKLGKHIPSQIEELILDDLYQNLGILTQDHKKALEQYSCLIHLSMKNLGLESLSNFPSILSLQILELSNNKLTDADLNVIGNLYPSLYKLKVSYNKIETIDCLNALTKTHIGKIEVEGNPFTARMPNHSAVIFKMFPEMKIVDKHDSKGQEIDTTNYDEEEEDDLEAGDDEEDEEFDEEDEEDEEFEDEEKEGDHNNDNKNTKRKRN